ncbi:S41 family peptidase [Chondrinema litorale]|uniref:S41 family peptidase n=1 Tax=Chondrinema litorale TaxID=2994555 RepID=UPI0025439C3D|nr:S41 family peptidase [Chondrinema litorale]UZR96092.1 S41 family peptidase [Chondrinema litorale]
MTRTYLIIIFCLLAVSSFAQSKSKCVEDMEKLYELLKKTPSYKSQIKGKDAKQYQRLVQHLEWRVRNTSDQFECFCKLAELFDPIKDNHLGFYQLPHTYIDPSLYDDPYVVKAYRKSPESKNFPRIDTDLDSLENLLAAKPESDIEGVYHYDTYLKAGLLKTENPDSLVAVILNTEIPNWEKGQIAFVLRKQEDTEHYTAYYAHPVHKVFLLVNNEKFTNGSFPESRFYGSLSNAIWRKNRMPAEDFSSLPDNYQTYELKQLNEQTQYVRLGSFSASKANVMFSDLFYTKLENDLQAKNLILDLRNNSGGADKVAKKFLKLLGNYAEEHKIYAIVNNRTFSEAEKFIIELSKHENVTTLGETTNGTLAYGSNLGTKITLPSGDFQVYLTDTKDSGNYLNYEGKGLAPDVALNPQKDWIEQVKEEIKQRN